MNNNEILAWVKAITDYLNEGQKDPLTAFNKALNDPNNPLGVYMLTINPNCLATEVGKKLEQIWGILVGKRVDLGKGRIGVIVAAYQGNIKIFVNDEKEGDWILRDWSGSLMPITAAGWESTADFYLPIDDVLPSQPAQK